MDHEPMIPLCNRIEILEAGLFGKIKKENCVEKMADLRHPASNRALIKLESEETK